QRLVGEVEHLIVGGVFDGVDLFEHHLALELQVAGAQHGIADEVGEHVEGARQVGVEHARVKGGGVARCVGVERAAAGLEGERDLLGRAALGPLEHHVLEQMGHAHLGTRLVGAGTPHPDADRRRAHARHPFREHQDAAWRGGLVDLPVEPDRLHYRERAGAVSGFSSSALRESRMRPRSSTSSSLTRTWSPFFTTSSVRSVRPCCSSEMCSRPSTPGRISIVMMRGAYLDSCERGCGMARSMMSRMWTRACLARSSASAMILKSSPSILMSIWIEVTPSRVPATLKSMSPRWSSVPRMSVSTATRAPSLISPMATPAHDAFTGTPASNRASEPPHTVAMEDEPLDSRMSETMRIV